MTRSMQLTAILLTGTALLTFNGCRTTVVQPAAQPAAQPAQQDDHHDDRRDDHNQPPPDHHDDNDSHDNRQ
jgi:hypothetical protein